MPFQTQVDLYQSPGVVGAPASTNPVAIVPAGPQGLTVDAAGLTVGSFAWISGTTNLGGGTASNTCPSSSTVAPYAPDGFVFNQHDAFITQWLGSDTLVIPQGYQCSLAERGDFWAKSSYGAAVRGQKVFANLFNGLILAAAAGSTPTNNIGSNASLTGSIDATGLLTVTAVASGVIEVGQLVQGAGIPANTYVQSLGTGTGGTGTYQLTTSGYVVASETITTTSPAGVGGASYTASIATNVLTVTAVAYGTLKVGMFVEGAGVAAGTYITSLGTGTGGAGTYNLSTSPGTQASGTYTASAWIETPWYVLSDGNPGDLIKIGVKN